MTERSKREIDRWAEENQPPDVEADTDLSSEEARVARKHDMITRGMLPDQTLSVEEQNILRRIGTRSP